MDLMTDYISGEKIPNMGAEENRQKVLKYLVEKKGFDKKDVTPGYAVEIEINGETYASRLDIVVSHMEKPFMIIKCAPGNLGSRERETLAASRGIFSPPLPVCAVSDGETALVMDGIKGDALGKGMDALPHKTDVADIMAAWEKEAVTLTEKRSLQEKIVFRSYDAMQVNVAR